jgi:hypothetical protein
MKTEIGSSTPQKSTTIQEEVTQAGDEVEGEAKMDHCILCITKEIQTTGQEIVQYFLSQEKEDPKAKLVFEPTLSQRSQPHNALATTITVIIIIILPFVPTLQRKTRAPTNLS